MNVETFSIPGPALLTPVIHGDRRGFFMETWRADRYAEALTPSLEFVQDNQSCSRQGVLRGLHFQTRKPQGKLVRCLSGAVYDVIVDLRNGSAHYGQWLGVTLDNEKHQQLWVPPGFAHGFLVLSQEAHIAYRCTDYYDPGGESGLRWDDPEVNIQWPIENPMVSAKDAVLPYLSDLKEPAPQV